MLRIKGGITFPEHAFPTVPGRGGPVAGVSSGPWQIFPDPKTPISLLNGFVEKQTFSHDLFCCHCCSDDDDDEDDGVRKIAKTSPMFMPLLVADPFFCK
jgi:hypothetical protein